MAAPFLKLIVLASLSFGICQGGLSPSVTIKTADGDRRIIGLYEDTSIYRGVNRNIFDIEAFLGIPYAEVRANATRFLRSELLPISKLSKTFSATKYKPGCMQEFGVFTTETKDFSEDCLVLNIWRRRGVDKGSRRPVMLIIHGGGYTAGDGHEMDWRGPTQAQFGDMVVVNINYRLGIFGFLDLNIPDAPGHMGHYDQILAMTWVKNNIEQFGGDPTRVTLMGVSAGSFSISAHLFSGKADGLFHAAIMDAGVLTSFHAETTEDHLKRATIAAKMANCPETTTADAIVKCLRGVNAAKLVEIQQSEGVMRSQTYTFRPTYNNDFLNGDPDCLAKNKKFKTKVPLLIGDVSNEGTFLMTNMTHDPAPNLTSVKSVLDWNAHIMSLHSAQNAPVKNDDVIKDQYGLKDGLNISTYVSKSADFIGDMFFVCPVMRFVDYYIDVENAYFFYWTRIRETETFPGEKDSGCYHGMMFYTSIGSEFTLVNGKMVKSDREYIINAIGMVSAFAAEPRGKNTPMFNRTNLEKRATGGKNVNYFTIPGLSILEQHPRGSICQAVYSINNKQCN